MNTILKLRENFTKYVYGRGFTSTTHRETSKLNNEKTNDSIVRGANSLNRQFTKEDIRIANKLGE